MKTVITMNSRRYGAYEAESYFIDVTKDTHRKIVRVFFINDDNRVESCELTIEADVLVNIATALQSDGCTNYQINVINGRIANRGELSMEQRIGFIEAKIGATYLNKKVPLDIKDKRTREVLYAANTKITKNVIREIALHFNTLDMDPSPFSKTIRSAIREAMK